MQLIGTDKVGFWTLDKHGSLSLQKLSDAHDIISGTTVDENHKQKHLKSDQYTILFPWRDNFECIKSGFFEDLRNHLEVIVNPLHIKKFSQIYSGNDKDLKKLFRFMFDRKNDVNFLFTESGHKHICFNHINFFWDNIFLNDNWKGCKFYFFDMKYMSDPRLIKWISQRDDKWMDVSIPEHKNRAGYDKVKQQCIDILKELVEELGEDYINYENYKNWKNFEYYYEFSKTLFNSIKKSKYFLDIEEL